MSQSPPPPPPPGGYGSPPPGGYGYGGQPPGAASWDVGTALSYGWTKFQANAGQIILAALALFVGVAVVVVGFVAIQSAIISYDTSFFVVLFLNAVFVAALIVVLQIIGAGIIRGALDITEGREFTAATVFKFQNVANVVVTALLIGAAVLVGTILCYLPGLVAGFVTSYALYFVVDKNMAPVDAIKASFELVKDNLGNTVIWYIVSAIVGGVGAIACGVGLLVTYPIAIIGTAYTYKRLTGQEVAP
ncbi:hypothetical protein ABFT23_13510 [Nocardioides sp. C4-1]|uniref:hypothetical protein n=1 Tax=Nocardioides sp. C4-1 TaxID=3151851 RepID=UPI003265D05C